MSSGIEDHSRYIDGGWAATSMIEQIEKTTYGNLETAIAVKEGLIKKFEDDFGFSRDMEEPESNYAFECGILDTLKKEELCQTQKKSNNQ